MNRRNTLVAVGILFGIAMWLQGPCLPAYAKLRIGMGAASQTDAKTVREIQQAFNQAEEAIGAGDLDVLMALYSEHYHHGSFTKEDVRKAWGSLFSEYRRISTAHSFSKIVVTPGTTPSAEVVCTGSIWATSSDTGQRVNLDSWLGEVHFLIYEDRTWRIRGPAKKAQDAMGFRAGPHPLF